MGTGAKLCALTQSRIRHPRGNSTLFGHYASALRKAWNTHAKRAVAPFVRVTLGTGAIVYKVTFLFSGVVLNSFPKKMTKNRKVFSKLSDVTTQNDGDCRSCTAKVSDLPD